MTSSTPYPANSYEVQIGGARASADVIAPLVTALLAPRSVLDVGCGAGAWMAAFLDLGIDDLVGIEGGHPDAAQLQVPPEKIRSLNLENEFDLGRRFDLVVSVEVAEHLPAAAATGFVASLTRHSDAILFSAAVPDQTGAWHINEQWPDYWHERFAAHGYACYDVLRRRVWNDDRVEWWYRQNMLLFAARDAVARLEAAGLFPEISGPLSLVHPDLFAAVCQRANRDLGIRETATMIPRLVRNRIAQARGRL